MGNICSNRVMDSNIKDDLKKIERTRMMDANEDKYDLLDDVELMDTVEDNMHKLKVSLEYWNELQQADRLVSDKRALKSALFMYKFCNSDELKHNLRELDFLGKYKLADLLVSVIVYCSESVRQYLRENEYLHDVNCNDSAVKQLKIRFFFFSYLLDIVCYFTDISNMFRLKFHQEKGTQALLGFLFDEQFVQNCLRFKYDRSSDASSIGLTLLESLAKIIFQLSKLADNFKSDWLELNATDGLIKFSHYISRYSYIRMISYMSIANIFRDKDIELMPDTLLVVRDIIRIINVGTQALVSNVNVTRTRIEITSSDHKQNTDALVIVYKDNQYNIIELLEALYRISINDTMKLKLYQDFDMKNILKKIIFFGNELEKEYATRLLYQLCFDSEVCSKVSRDDELFRYFTNLNSKHNESEYLRKNIFGILWLNNKFRPNLNSLKELDKIEEKKQSKTSSVATKHKHRTTKTLEEVELNLNRNRIIRQESVNSNDLDFKAVNQKVETVKLYGKNMPTSSISDEIREISPTNKPEKEHIMISYNKESRDMCLGIKADLEKDGHKVWIDVQDIHGSSLESMANAIENSKCVIICMTEKYKQSPNCRAEAEYAFNLRKPIIPVIMQKNYTPDGWLGIILGTKIYVNFTKYSLDECMKKLKIELKNVIAGFDSTQGDQKVDVDLPLSSAFQQNNSENSKTAHKIESWNNQDVKKWLNEKGFHPLIINEMNDFDGELMIKLNDIIKRFPNYMLDRFSKYKDLDLYSVVKFLNEFEKLFL